MEEKKISIIIPAFNEAENIGVLIRNIRGSYASAEIIVVDDGSTDATAEAALGAGAIVYSHPYNIGNGAAIKTGIRSATSEILVFMDADGQHNTQDISRLIELVSKYDMVVGERSFGGQASWGRAIGNIAYNWLGSYVTKFQIKDLTSGFRAVKADVARNFLHLLPNSYSYPTTLTLGALRSGRSLKYIPIEARKRRAGSSQIKLFRDGVRFFMIITKICTLYSPMRVFLPVSAAMFVMGLINYLHSYLTQGRFTNMSALLFVTSVLIFMMSLISEQICQMRYERRETPRAVRREMPNEPRTPS